MTPEQIEKVRAGCFDALEALMQKCNWLSSDQIGRLRGVVFPWMLARAEHDAAEIERLKAQGVELCDRRDADAELLRMQEDRIAALESCLAAGEPVAWRAKDAHGKWHYSERKILLSDEPLYLTPPAQPPAAQVPDAMVYDSTIPAAYVNGWNACRAAMLAAKESKT